MALMLLVYQWNTQFIELGTIRACTIEKADFERFYSALVECLKLLKNIQLTQLLGMGLVSCTRPFTKHKKGLARLCTKSCAEWNSIVIAP